MAIAILSCKKGKDFKEEMFEERKVAFDDFIKRKIATQSDENIKKQKLISDRDKLLIDLSTALSRKDTINLLISFEKFVMSLYPDKISRQQMRNSSYRINYDDPSNPYYEFFMGILNILKNLFLEQKYFLVNGGCDENRDPI